MFRTFSPASTRPSAVGKFLRILIYLTIGVMIAVYIIALFPQLFRYKDLLLESNFKVTLVLIFLLVCLWLNYIFFNSKTVAAAGNLSLKEEAIELNGTVYPLEELKNIRFIGNDIRNDFRGYISKGEKNSIALQLQDGTEVSSVFEQTQDENLKKYPELLSIYLNKGLLSKSNYQNILNNTNYY